jgi:hypothetical protein
LLAIVLAEIEELDACQLSGFAGPSDATNHLDRLGKAMERDREASDQIAGEAGGR